MAAPTAPTLGTPADNAPVNLTNGVNFTWTHNDADGDPQASYALRRRAYGSASYQYWTGSAWSGTETFVSTATQSVTVSDWPSSSSTYYWSVATKDPGGGTSPYATERAMNPYEWWTGSGWSYSETYITSSTTEVTIASATHGDGHWEWAISTKDSRSATSPYSSTRDFYYGTAPLAPTLVAPADKIAVDLLDGGITFQWTNNDPGDTQAAYALRRRSPDSASYQWWTGSAWSSSETFVTSTVSEVTITDWPNSTESYYWSVATRDPGYFVGPYSSEWSINPWEWWNGSTWTYTSTYVTSTTSQATVPTAQMPDGTYEWTASTKDSQNVISPYATAWTLSLATAPDAPDLVGPADGVAIDLSAGPTFEWTHNHTAFPQYSYALRRRQYLVTGINGAGASYEWWNAGTSSWQGTEIYNVTSTESVAVSNWPTSDATYYWSVSTRITGGYTSPYATERLFNPWEWWNGTAWVNTETFVFTATSAATVAGEEFALGEYKWSVSTKDALGNTSDYAVDRTVEFTTGARDRWGHVHI